MPQSGNYRLRLACKAGHIAEGYIPQDVKIDLEVSVHYAVADGDDLAPGNLRVPGYQGI